LTRAGVALAAATIVWLGQPGGVSAHALIVESTPRPDDTVSPPFSRVVLRFNSRIEEPVARVWIVGPDGGRVPLRVNGNAPPGHLIAAVPVLAPGSYRLEWQVLSADGHLTRGSFQFRVASPP